MAILPELLSPAGNWAALQAALAAGADGVYLGLSRFNARLRADNFTRASLFDAVEFAHRHGRRVYVAINTLLTDSQLGPAVDDAAAALAAGADAVIVQDAGFASVLRRTLPKLAVHASTQATVLSPEGVCAMASLGVKRVILARELSLDEIRECVAAGRKRGVGVEVFAHGALCVGLSGQCLLSHFASGRSGNRGVCEQCCRLKYYSEGKTEGALALSLHDLAAFRVLPELVATGVAALKIEGRLKGANYVAAVTRLYRRALDLLREGKTYDAAQFEEEAALVFNRGFTDGYLRGGVTDAMRQGERSNPFGRAPDGVVENHDRLNNILRLRMRRPAAVGDGYALVLPDFSAGFHVIRIEEESKDGLQSVVARFGKSRLPPIPKGAPVWRNSAEQFEAELQPLLAGLPKKLSPVRVAVSGKAGEPLKAKFESERGCVAEAASESRLAPAKGKGIDEKLIREKLASFGGTRFEAGDISIRNLAKDLFLPISELKAMRRELVSALEEKTLAGRRSSPEGLYRLPEGAPRPEKRARVAVAAESSDDVRAAFNAGAEIVYAGAEALPKPGAFSLGERRRIFVRVPVTASGKQLKDLLAASEKWGGVLAGSFAALVEAKRRDLPVVADTSLNALNAETAMALASAGAFRVAWSLEASANDMAKSAEILARNCPALETEAVLSGSIMTLVTRQPLGLAAGARSKLISENGRTYSLRRGADGWTRAEEFLDRSEEAGEIEKAVDVIRIRQK